MTTNIQTIAASENCQNLECVSRAAVMMLNSTCGVEPVAIAWHDGQGEALVLGIVSLVGDVEWSLHLGLPKATAVNVAARFAGFDIPFEGPDMGDAVGELTNIFAGQVKALLDQRGVKADISLPNVLRADNMQVLIQRHSSSLKLCFDSPLGSFWTGVLTGQTPGLPK